MPALEKAGNVVYKQLTFKLSLRLPPTLQANKAAEILKQKFNEEKEDTYGATVIFKVNSGANGFDAPKLPEDLMTKIHQA